MIQIVKWFVPLCIGGLLAGADDSVKVGNLECCGAAFEFQDVVSFAKDRITGLGGPYYSLRITPSTSKLKGGIATSSHESVAFCVSMAKRLRSGESHAYLLKTPLGVAVHHWDSGGGRYQKITLSGVDVYDIPFREGRVAWISDYLGQSPKLWLVSDKAVAKADALAFAKRVMTELSINRAVAYVRTDSYYWPPDSCSPYSLPLQWREEAPLDATEISRETMFCKINREDNLEVCTLYRSK